MNGQHKRTFREKLSKIELENAADKQREEIWTYRMTKKYLETIFSFG
jgi:hypothetical protein